MPDIEIPDIVDIQVDVSEETAEDEREDSGGQGETSTQPQSQTPAGNTQKGNPKQPTLPRERALTSNVWDHVTRFKDENGYPRARCNYCNVRTFKAHTKKNGTSSIRSHEALKDLFEEYRRAPNPQTSQAKGAADLMDEQVDDDTGDAMQQFLKHQKVSSEFDPEAETHEQLEIDKVCLDLKKLSVEPNVDN
ncbi:putative Zinc finger, BED-type [Corchorus olitorius]|uniref:Zinc finger, BED-type n=1 Tax=Corchorus olitorius TaxID=93759 RepID=A0A1R3H1T8_9ROSI|nr:putative Zinc finger, BED-type [Corchorus olitorius]